MKQSRIYMKRWLAANERSKQVPTDTWYLHFASQLLLLIDQSPLYCKKSETERVDAAISLGSSLVGSLYILEIGRAHV